MARKPPIRIMARDREEYARVVKNTRAKMSRIRTKYGVETKHDIHIPKLTDFKHRDEYNRKIEELASFRNRSNSDYQYYKNPYGVVMTKAEISKADRLTRAVQHQADRAFAEIKDLPVSRRGGEYSTVGEQAGHFTKADTTGIYRPEDFDPDKMRSRSRLQTVLDSREKRLEPDYFNERDERMRENFITKLEGSFHGEESNVVAMLRKIPASDFKEMWLKLDEIDFDMYDSDGEHVIATTKDIEYIEQHLEKYFEGDIDTDLSQF